MRFEFDKQRPRQAIAHGSNCDAVKGTAIMPHMSADFVLFAVGVELENFKANPTKPLNKFRFFVMTALKQPVLSPVVLFLPKPTKARPKLHFARLADFGTAKMPARPFFVFGNAIGFDFRAYSRGEPFAFRLKRQVEHVKSPLSDCASKANGSRTRSITSGDARHGPTKGRDRSPCRLTLNAGPNRAPRRRNPATKPVDHCRPLPRRRPGHRPPALRAPTAA